MDQKIDLDVLQQKSRFIKKIRRFFDDLGYLEVSTPCLTPYPASEPFIDPIAAFPFSKKRPYFLITSPEYYMKRLLLGGSGAIYQISPAFRKFETGSCHNPEFTMLEWYAPKYSYQKIMSETTAFLKDILNIPKIDSVSYQDCFLNTLGIDPLANPKTLEAATVKIKKSDYDFSKLDFYEKLDYLLAFYIQPTLGMTRPVMIYDFIIDAGSLAQPHHDNKTAARFEVYYKGVELCNGCMELTDGEKVAKKLTAATKLRKKKGKTTYPEDIIFLQAMKKNLPQTAGVALGVDRLLMAYLQKETIAHVQAFSLSEIKT